MAKIKTNSTAAEQVAVNITPRAFFRFALMVVATLVLIISVRKASHALLLVFTAFVLTLALNAPIYWVSKHIPGKRRGSRSIATTLSFLIVIIILGGIISLVVPRLVHQTESLVNAAPHLVQDFRSQNGTVGKFVRKYHLQKQLTSFSSQLSDRLHNIGGTAFSTAQKIGSSAFSLVTILALTFMMLIEGPGWLKFMRQTVPNGHRDMADRLSQDMYRVIRGYVNGQVLLAAIATALIIPAVLILHIGYPLALIAVIFVCGLIPMVGHTIGAVIVTLVALFHSLDSS
jgi:predicted PurR-regulated permease PerM